MNAPLTINRAYSLLDIKEIDDEERTIRGIATTPTADRLDDVVDAAGAKFVLPLPLLWQHDAHRPIGHVTEARVTDAGIEIAARVEKGIDEDIDKAWKYIRARLVRGLSIGFRALESEPIKAKGKFGTRFKSWEWMELSAVTIPANAEASITSIKSIDQKLRAASGHVRKTVTISSGVTGATRKGSAMKTLADQIAAFEATRAAKAARMTEIMQTATDDNRSTDAAEQEEFDTLEQEVEAIDSDLKRLASAEKANKAAATPVSSAVTPARAADIRGGASAIMLKQEIPKGTGFIRYVMALAATKGNRLEAADIAKRWQGSTPEVEMLLRQPDMLIRAAVAPGTTTDSDWAQPLVDYRRMAGEFVELLRPATIVGRIPGIRVVPFMVQIPTQTQAALVNWVGEAQPKPVSELKFGMIQLDVNKVAGIVVLSEELVRLSSPSAEAVVRADLIAQIAQFLDVEFIDPANAAVAGVSPASITNGISGIASSGTSALAARTDLQALINQFIGANLGLGDAVWITTESIALQLGMLQNPLGQPEFSTMGLTGGTLLGRPVIASQSVPAGMLILAKASEILMADDGGVTIDASREATLQMDSAPTAGGAATFSLWQNNCVGIRAERWITWRRRRDQAVSFITGANYTGEITTP